MRLIAVSGYARAGKDSVGDILVEEGYERVSFAKIMKDMALAIDPIISFAAYDSPIRLTDAVLHYGWDETKRRFAESRRFLQRLGTEGGRIILGPALGMGSDIWVEALMRTLDPSGSYVVTDCRFENEAVAVKNYGGTVWRVERPGIVAANAHISEKSLDNWNFDVRIANDGNLTDLGILVRAQLDGLALPRTDPDAAGIKRQTFPCVDNDGEKKAIRR